MHHDFLEILGASRWLIEPKALRAIIRRAEAATPEAIERAHAAAQAYSDSAREPRLKLAGDVAIIDACGPITYRRTWFSYFFGGATIEDLQLQLRLALADPAVKTIAFRWDSPGGCVDMVPEFADEVFAARGQKPLVSIADTLICSAAYWIAAQTDQIYGSASAMIGSIGVYLEHWQYAGMLEKAGATPTLISHGVNKTAGNAYEPLSDEARAEFQRQVDQVGDEFDKAVARGRGVTKQKVLQDFGQGKVFRGKEAIAIGLADKPGTFTQVLGKLTKGRLIVSAAAPSGVVDDLHEHADATVPALVGKATKKADGLEPVDGECEDGYALGDDGLCYLVPDENAKAAAAAANDEAAILAAGAQD